VALEAAFWDALRGTARSHGLSLVGLVAKVDSGRDATTPLASALRVLALRDAQGNAQARNAGERISGTRTGEIKPTAPKTHTDLNER
jgi:predicted DNA-binding ribbon-helix-helix protein